MPVRVKKTRQNKEGFRRSGEKPIGECRGTAFDTKDQEQVMKLNEAQISKILAQFRAQVLSEDHPAVRQFCELFGHHTFFLDAKGLHVLELLEVPGMEAQDGEIVSLADWSDADFTKLTTHRPEPTGLVIRLKEVQH
jgi:hypothetical protein